jgi:hypothetical protein
VLLRNNLIVSALIFALLEVWRPCFFLTDDNLDSGFTLFTEMGWRLLHGQSPFVTEYLYGGNYNLLRDATFFTWHPVYLLSSLLVATPFHFWIIDVDAFVFLMLTTAGFVNLAWYLREQLALRIGDGWIMFYTMSYCYSVILLALGASWLNYIPAYGALPWLTLGILQNRWRDGIGLVALFSLHQILGGHMLALISNTIFLSLFAGAVSIWRKSWLPVGSWAIGYVAALVVILPLFLPMFEGFLSSSRAQGVPITEMASNNIDLIQLPTSLFVGMALSYIHPPDHVHITYMLAFGSCAAAWCLVPALAGRGRWRGLDLICLGMILFGVFMVCRPLWVTEVMSHLPILRSMRWPFREIVQFQFFIHLFLVVRRPGMTPRTRRLTALFSASLMVLPLFIYKLPPTLNAMNLNREILFSGDFDRYWDRVRPLFKPGDRIAVLIPFDLYVQDRIERPNCLLSTYNFSCMTRVVNVSGYSHTVPADQTCLPIEPYFPNGAYAMGQRDELLRLDPQIKIITLVSLEPLRITLSSRDGPVVNLDAYLPPRAAYFY